MKITSFLVVSWDILVYNENNQLYKTKGCCIYDRRSHGFKHI